MKSFIESLSLGTGAIFVAALSAVLVFILCFACPKRLHQPLALIVPFVIAVCLYWSPVWLGADPSEYGAWQFIVVGSWFLAGAIPSAAIAYILHRRGVGSIRK